MSDIQDIQTISRKPILFYDGECGFCNSTVQFILNHEQAPVLMFAPLQGPTAEETLRDANLPADIADKSIVIFDNGQHLVRSRAAVRVLLHMGNGWATLGRLLALVPSPVADMVYRIIAANRKRLPQAQSCEMLPPEKRKRFLP